MTFTHHAEGLLTAEHSKQNIPIPFDLPAGLDHLALTAVFETHEEMLTEIAVSLYDPNGSRGGAHRHFFRHEAEISAAAATPGFIAGALPAGRWSLEIDTHLILPDVTVRYSVDIRAEARTDIQPRPPFVIPQPKPSEGRGPGWFRGDLHGHTFHTDGEWDVSGLLAHARAARLDFVTLSDHNTVSPLAEMDSLSAPDLLTMGGMELTTFYGHALALGVREWVDWRTRPGRGMPEIAAEVVAKGGTFIIAHPMSPGDPVCSGCTWLYENMMPGSARVVEIWNGTYWNFYSQDGLELWYKWLNEGYRMIATSGMDIHRPLAPGVEYPVDVVYADTLSEAAILQAVRAGRLYISGGPVLDWTGTNAEGQRVMVGETLPGTAPELRLRWSRCHPTDTIRWIVDGEAREMWMGEAGEEVRHPHEFRWSVVEVRAAGGELRAVTNPIFRPGAWR